MIPVEPMFWYGLALKIAVTAGIVVSASIIVERSGPFIGALIASLPTAGGAAMIILAVEHPPAFIAASTVGSMVANADGGIFALTYAALAQRRSLPVSLGGAFAVWFAVALSSRLIDWSVAGVLLASAVVYPPAILLARRFQSAGAVNRVGVTARDLAWRAGVVTLCVIVVTAASNFIGSYYSGVFAFFPVAMGSFFVILQPRIGGPAAASVAAHVITPLIGLTFGLLAVHLLAVRVGTWRSYLVGLVICVAWNALLWLLRQRKLRSVQQA